MKNAVDEDDKLYDGRRIIAEYSDGTLGTLAREYFYGIGIDEIVATREYNGNMYYYHENSLGSIYAATSITGTAVERYSYTVYGAVTFWDSTGTTPTAQSAIGNRFLFTGREYDSDTGLYYYRARYYDPEMGRFINRDSAEDDNLANLYTYCINNPINFTDPFGLRQSLSNEATQKSVNDAVGSWEKYGTSEIKGKISDYKDKHSDGIKYDSTQTQAGLYYPPVSSMSRMPGQLSDEIRIGQPASWEPVEELFDYINQTLREHGVAATMDFESREQAIEFIIAHELYEQKLRGTPDSQEKQADCDAYAMQEYDAKMYWVLAAKKEFWDQTRDSPVQICSFIPSEALGSELDTMPILVLASPGQVVAGYMEGGFGGIGIPKTLAKIPKTPTLLFTEMLTNEVSFEAVKEYQNDKILHPKTK